MILFVAVAAALVLAALAFLLLPLLRRRGGGADDRASVVAVFRRQLADIDAEFELGTVSAEEAAAARTEITRHLLAAADREARQARLPPGSAGEISWRVGAAVAIAGIVPAAAFVLYLAVGAPAAIEIAAGAAPAEAGAAHDGATLAAATDQLAARLAREPNHPRGWILLARSSASLGRFAAARKAYRRAIAMQPDDTGLHAELGEVLVLEAGGVVTPAAKAEFATTPGDPRARYYLAEAVAQAGDTAGAEKALSALLAEAPANAPWRSVVEKRLAAIKAQGGAAASPPPAAAAGASAAPPPAPSAAMVAAAQQMTPQQRQAMIEGMVARLAARLAAQPDDPQGWLMLARSYRTLGRNADAVAALKSANAHVHGNLDLLKAYMAALGGGVANERLTPEVAGLASRIHALDDKEPDALWYLGLAAAAHGDPARAATYWRQLVAVLPAGGADRAAVERRLAALR
ncbi:MAG TPA: c-type cytochrome biogenesis protein CcmI [Stellaceae bacterium]|nr:c-type cytochrome biogenesis protein CcmI [Stellaceae bacterium]